MSRRVGLAANREEAFTTMIEIEDRAPGVRIVRINRPKALNALNGEVLRSLTTALEAAMADVEVRVLILTGAGDRAFIAGADILEMKEKSSEEALEFARLGQKVTKLLDLMPKPTIAAVNGFALGGGTEMAIACDFIVASDRAVFGQPEVALGIMPGFGATARLMKFVGAPRAKELIFSGRRIKADEALRIGLVNHVWPQEEFAQKVHELASQIAENSAPAVLISKRLINSSSESVGMGDKLENEAKEFSSLFGSHDQREGMDAFAEKRKATFKGLAGA